MAKSKGMETLYYSDKIDKGIYAGETVRPCLKRYGKKAIKELLKYYDFCEAIMLDYHFHLRPHEDNTVKAEETVVKKTVAKKAKVAKKIMEVEMEAAKEAAMEDIESSGEDVLELPGNIGLDLNNWVAIRTNRKSGVLYDPEDDPEDAYHDTLKDGAWLRERGYDYAMTINS